MVFAALTSCLVPIFSGHFGYLFLVGVLAAGGVVLLVGHPHWGVLAILGLWFSEFSPDFLDAEFLRIPYLVAAVLLVPLAVQVLRARRLWVLSTPEVRILAAIGALLLLSTWWANFDHPNLLFPDLDRTQRQLIRFGSRLVFLIFFATFTLERRQVESTVWLILLLIAVAAVTSWGSVFGTEETGRAAASFGFATNSNRLAFVCWFATAMVWFYRSDGPPGAVRRLIWPLLILLPVTALASGSRGGFFQAIALVALILRDQSGASTGRRVRNVFLVGCAALVLLAVVPGSLLQRATTFEARSNAPGGESLQNRIRQLESAGDLFIRHPLLGIGPGNFDWMSTATFGAGDTPHNSYLLALTEGGPGVFALYLALFAATYRRARRIEREGREDLRWLGKALRIDLVLLWVASATGDIWLDDPLYWIVALALAATALSARAAPGAEQPSTNVPRTLAVARS